MKLLLSLLAISSPAFASTEPTVSLSTLFSQVKANEPSCYGREYSTEHMEKNEKQTVKKMRVKMVRDLTEPSSPSEYLDVEIALKGEENFFKTYRAFLICDSKQGECYVECDGGRVKAWGAKDGSLTLQNLGFVIQGGCGGDEGTDNTVMLKPTKGGDDIFKLVKLPSQYCQL